MLVEVTRGPASKAGCGAHIRRCRSRCRDDVGSGERILPQYLQVMRPYLRSFVRVKATRKGLGPSQRAHAQLADLALHVRRPGPARHVAGARSRRALLQVLVQVRRRRRQPPAAQPLLAAIIVVRCP